MRKKISTLIITTVFALILSVNTFAYSNMYQTGSNIPDFSEFTGANFTGKDYALGGTIYYYDLPMSDGSLDLRYVNWFYKYISELNKNGYSVCYTNFFNDYDNIIVGLFNPNKGLYVDIYSMEFGVAITIHK